MPWSSRTKLRLLIMVMALGLNLTALAGMAPAVPQGDYVHPEILIQPEELKTRIDQGAPDLRVIDMRDKARYEQGHIPGAVRVWGPELEDKAPLPGKMAPRAKIEEVLGRLGISNASQIVIYPAPNDARLWWLLAYYGFPLSQMKFLDGGIEAWQAKGYALEQTTPVLPAATFKLRGAPARENLLCTISEVKKALQDPQKVILDTRSLKEYAGEELKEGAVKPGHIPGVTLIEWQGTLVKQGPFKGYRQPGAAIRQLFAGQGITPDKEVYIY